MSLAKSVTQQAKQVFFRTSHGLRSTRFLAQYTLANLFLGRKPSEELKDSLPHPKLIIEDMRSLLELDAANLASGVYSAASTLKFKPLENFKLGLRAFVDLWRVKNREKNRDVLLKDVASHLSHLPRYYRQAFHYQSNGWLSEESADLYDYQVETLFGGSAGAMRRQALIPILEFLKTQNPNEVKILDLAAGTGTFAQELKDNFPNTQVTLSDLSPFYLKKARQRLASYSRLDFVEANAEALPFQDNSFDVVVCVYLFHELPRRVRAQVAQEIARVLKPGGLFVFADSIQLGDKLEFDASLKHFPIHYHEPYYLDYIAQDLDEVFGSVFGKAKYAQRAFFTKILAFRNPKAISRASKE
jgi:ubiquinone/menaquinone biosynthesis C-methylase UbiE